MSTTIDDELKEIAEDLDINVNNILHFIILGGVEVVGEVLPTSQMEKDSNGKPVSDDVILINPVKILRDSYVSEEEYIAQHFFVEWNPCGDSPFAPLNPELIISKMTPNEQTIRAYLNTVHKMYYPFEIEFELDPELEAKLEGKELDKKSNVIPFAPYLTRKVNPSEDL